MKPRYICATALYCGALFMLSSRSHPPGSDWTLFNLPEIDKIAHLILYAGLAALVSFGIRRSDPETSASMQFWLPLTFATLYGLSDEIHQLFVPLRSFDPLDLLADAVGATMAQVILYKFLWSTPAAHDTTETE